MSAVFWQSNYFFYFISFFKHGPLLFLSLLPIGSVYSSARLLLFWLVTSSWAHERAWKIRPLLLETSTPSSQCMRKNCRKRVAWPRAFHYFEASKSSDRLISCGSEASIDEFGDFEVSKCSVKWVWSSHHLKSVVALCHLTTISFCTLTCRYLNIWTPKDRWKMPSIRGLKAI